MKWRINRKKKRRKQNAGRMLLLCLTLCAAWAALVFPLWREMEKTGLAMAQYVAPAESEETEAPFLLDAPFIDQREKYPTGCECVAATMALQYYGVEVTPEDMIAAMPTGTAPHPDGSGGYVGCDPRKAFPGDPHSRDGWGCCAPVILQTAEDILRERDETSLSMLDLTGTSLPTLCSQYLRQGVPVLIWATIHMEPPTPGITFTIEGTTEQYRWIYPFHCLLLVGEDETSYYFNDPMAGKNTAYDKAAVEAAYEGLGCQAVAFLRLPPTE